MARACSLIVVLASIVVRANADQNERGTCGSKAAVAPSSGLMQINAHSSSKVKAFDACTENLRANINGVEHAYTLSYGEFNCPVPHQTMAFEIHASAREFSVQIPVSNGLTMSVFPNTASANRNCSDFRRANAGGEYDLLNGSAGEATLNGAKFFENANASETIGLSWVSSVGEAGGSSAEISGSGGETFLVFVQAGDSPATTGCPPQKKFRLEVAQHGDTINCPRTFNDISCTLCDFEGCNSLGAFGDLLRGSSFAVTTAWDAVKAVFRIAGNSFGGLAPPAPADAM